MNAEILLSGYDKSTQLLAYRVYCTALPETERRRGHRLEHLTALDLLGAALLEDFGVRHAKIVRRGIEKPALIHDFLHMNLSHCKGLAVCAMGRLPVGIDCERPRAVKDHLLDRICAPEEAAAIRAATDRETAFSRLWTLKEAYGKFTGRGIREPLDTLQFELGDSIRFVHPASEDVMFFQMIRGNQHIISVCLPKSDLQIESAEAVLCS
jgi:4'-phosphopantetheinyl transferase